MKKIKFISIISALIAFGLVQLYAWVPAFQFFKEAIPYFVAVIIIGWITWGLITLTVKD